MCRAEFSSNTGRPVVTATIILPRFGVSQEVPFIIDTGADRTSIAQVASLQMGIHPTIAPDELSIQEQTIHGAGGETAAYTVNEPLRIAFEEEDPDRDRWSLHIEHKNSINILPHVQANLLGRDIINRFVMDYNPGDGVIELRRDDFSGGRYECLTVSEQPSEQIDDWINR